MRRLPALIVLAVAATAALAHPGHEVPDDRLLPEDQRWELVDGRSRYVLPEQLPELRALPADRRRRLERLIEQHDLNVRFVRKAIKATRGAVRGGRLKAKPEYRAALAEIVIGVDRELAAGGHPLHAHEPVLLALPSYTRIDVMTPAAFRADVERDLRVLGLEHRARVVVHRRPATDRAATRWARDTLLVAGDPRSTIFRPLSYWPRRELQGDDLRYLDFLRTSRRDVVTVPLFYRAGNLLLGIADRPLLFVGRDEMAGNHEVYRHTAGAVPPPDAVLEVFAALTGAAESVLLPNTRRLFHIDMYMSFLADGVAALLDPLDPDALPAEERAVLHQAREELTRRGFRIVPIPTVAARIAAFQSSTNIVPYIDRDTGARRALVPDFPDLVVGGESLNRLVARAYRDAGIEPVFVEDRFYPSEGNTHCVTAVLR